MEWVNAFVGIPYLYGGNTRAGADCWGLVRIVLDEHFNKILPEIPHDDSCPCKLQEIVNTEKVRYTKIEMPEPGDIVLVKIIGLLSHVGVYVGGGMMLHTLREHDSVVTYVAEGKWSKRIAGYYRAS